MYVCRYVCIQLWAKQTEPEAIDTISEENSPSANEIDNTWPYFWVSFYSYSTAPMRLIFKDSIVIFTTVFYIKYEESGNCGPHTISIIWHQLLLTLLLFLFFCIQISKILAWIPLDLKSVVTF